MGKYKTLYAESLLSGAAPPRRAAGPVQCVIADTLGALFGSVLFGAGACGVYVAASDMQAFPDVARFAVGAGCGLLAFTTLADVVGPTLGQACDKATDMACGVIEAWRGGAELPEASTAPVVQKVRIEEIEKNKAGGVKRLATYDLPGTERQLKEFANYALGTDTISEAGAKKATSIGGTRWDKLKGAMLTCGYIRWKNEANHNDGMELTRKGIIVCKSLSNYPTPRVGSW